LGRRVLDKNNKMYNKQYAKKWIQHAESGDDYFRHHLIPFIQQAAEKARQTQPSDKPLDVLDIGCGWGEALKHLPEDALYTGIDPVKEFLDYIREKHPKRQLILRQGALPFDILAKMGSHDLVLCSMALHCVEDLSNSVYTLFTKAKPGGLVAIADFNDQAEQLLRKSFVNFDINEKNHVKGLYQLSDNVQIEAEAYLHKEKQIEAALRRRGKFEKVQLGPIFVGYYSRKQAKPL